MDDEASRETLSVLQTGKRSATQNSELREKIRVLAESSMFLDFFFTPISKIEYFSLSHRDLWKGPFLSVLIQLILWLHQSNKSYSGSLSSTRKVLILCENITIRQREGKNKIEQKKRFFLPRGRNKNGQKSFPSSHARPNWGYSYCMEEACRIYILIARFYDIYTSVTPGRSEKEAKRSLRRPVYILGFSNIGIGCWHTHSTSSA